MVRLVFVWWPEALEERQNVVFPATYRLRAPIEATTRSRRGRPLAAGSPKGERPAAFYRCLQSEETPGGAGRRKVWEGQRMCVSVFL